MKARGVGGAVVATALVVVVPMSGARAEEPVGPDLPVRARAEHPRLAPSLRDDLDAGVPVLPASEAAHLPGPADPALVTVVVEAESTAAARAAVDAAGGAVTVALDGLVQADVAPSELGRLADARGVDLVREPRPAVPAVTSEGVSSTNSATWQGAGWNGAGTKVAIVDVGFAGWASRVGAAGELGAAVTTDLGRCPDPEGFEHGTAVAEIVHDMAPGAALHLVCVRTDIDFINALQTLAALGVDVVNGSIGWTGTSRGDGSGGESTTPAGAVRALRRQGILYVASAGNYGQSHWHGAAAGDGDGPGFGDFVDITGDDTLTFFVAPGGVGMVTIQWDQWTGGASDFDLYVENVACAEYWVSEFDQTNGAPPIEWTGFENCSGSAQMFRIWVNRFAGGGAPRIDVFLDGEACCLEAATAQSSLPEPAASSAALTVGGACWVDGSLRPYSSQGPTIDGRVKPDVTAPDGVSTSVYGGPIGCSEGFQGTSASAPHVAGAAAQLLGRNPNLDVAELQQLLMDRALDAGPAGDDSQFGAGHLRMGGVNASGAAAPRPPQPFTSIPPVRLLDTRPNLTGVAEVPARSLPIGGGVGGMYALPVVNVAGIPADATAVVLNVTVTEPSNHSYVAVQPGTNPPTTSNLNFVPGQTVAQHVTATVAPDGKVRIYNNFGTAHVVVDVAGWYGPTGVGGAASARFSSLAAPARALDTRSIGTGYAEVPARSAPLTAGAPYELPLAGLAGVPAGATGVILNVTITEPSAVAHLNVWPADQPLPVSSSVNVAAGQTVANLVVVKLSSAAPTGRIRMQLSSGAAHVVVDTIGWYQDGVGAGYVSLDPPARQIDTRSGTGPRLGPLSTSETHQQEVGRYQGVPADAEAVMLGVVAVTPTAGGFLTLFPTGQPRPNTSNVNFTPGSIVPNAVVAGLGTGARVSYFNHFGLTHVVSDVSGYFLDPADAPVPAG